MDMVFRRADGLSTAPGRLRFRVCVHRHADGLSTAPRRQRVEQYHLERNLMSTSCVMLSSMQVGLQYVHVAL